MSDFIARIAARAVGEAPAARPRLPSVFEGATPHGQLGLEVVEAEVPATRPPVPAQGRLAVPGRDAPPAASEAEPSGTRREPEVREQTAPLVPPPAEPETQATPITSAEPTGLEPEPVPAVARAGDPEPTPAEAARVVVPPAETVPAAPSVAVPPPVATAVPRVARPRETELATARVAALEPSSVRVHIGRLEVRANLQRPATPRPRARDEERPPELSLADYLRGRRVGA